MRKQYNFWPGPTGLDAWDVGRLISLSSGLPVLDVELSSIAELDTPYWSVGPDASMTVRDVITHAELIQAADLSYPIILSVDGRVMDGMHRIAKAVLLGLATITAVQFAVDPEPDHRNCRPDALPY